MAQFDSNTFRRFSLKYQFRHLTSSPYYPRGNREAERRVKIVKSLLKKGDEPYLALLTYKINSLNNGYSPAELLINWKLDQRVMAPTQKRSLMTQSLSGGGLPITTNSFPLKKQSRGVSS